MYLNKAAFLFSNILVWNLEKAMATHSSTLAWKILWTEEPGGLQSMGLLRVGHNWATSLSFFLSCIGEGNGNPLQCSCLVNPRDRGAWWAAVYGAAQSRTWLKRLSSSSTSSMKLVSINLRNGKKASVARNRMIERELKGKIGGKQGQTTCVFIGSVSCVKYIQMEDCKQSSNMISFMWNVPWVFSRI